MTEDKNTKKSFLRTDRGKLTAVIATAGAIIVGSFGVQAIAENKTVQHLTLAASGPGVYSSVAKEASWSKGWGHSRRGGHGRFANMSDAEIEKLVTRMVKHVSIEIDATDEQEQKIITLVTAVAKDMKPMREQFRAAGKEMHDLLLADTIDRNALEKLRAERLAEADRISKNLATALVDVAEILTPEQRKKLDARIKDFREHRRGWGHGWRRG